MVCFRTKSLCTALAFCAQGFLSPVSIFTSASGPAAPLILRIRKADGSMGKIQIANQESTTLSSVLSTFSSNDASSSSSSSSSAKCSIANKEISDTDKPISSFNLKNGSIISITPPKKSKQEIKAEQEAKEIASASLSANRYTAFDPYPSLARGSHSAAARRSRALARLPNKRSMSYSDIANLHSFMHTIEPQPEGPIKRIYMCHVSAQRFKDNCTILPTKVDLTDD